MERLRAPSHARHRARHRVPRRPRRRAPAAALVLALAAPLAWGSATAPTTTPTPTTAVTTTAVTTTSVPAPPTTLVPTRDPFTTPGARAFLAGVSGNLTAGVEDLVSHRVYLYRPGVREYTASLVKIDILATLLHEAAQAGRSLSARQQRLARAMIEESSNAAASVLWAQAGGRDAVASFDALAGMTQTVPSWSWGAIATTARDQLALLDVITQPNALLGAPARTLETSLMEQVAGFERFGVGWGAPPGATVALKDGWYHEPVVGWQVDSAGLVRDGSRAYLVAMMINRGPSEGADEATLTALARLIAAGLRP